MNDHLLNETLTAVGSVVKEAIDVPAPGLRLTETGTITYIGGGIARVRGLRSVRAE